MQGLQTPQLQPMRKAFQAPKIVRPSETIEMAELRCQIHDVAVTAAGLLGGYIKDYGQFDTPSEWFADYSRFAG
jgi:hypothetical protein